tara:strand:- start:147 stop:509 length:363 start_codon:yes stop_codon:yes gene_type:complete
MKHDISHALRKLYPEGAKFVQEGYEYSGLKWVDERPKPTEKEINDKIVELDSAEPLKLLQEERNRRLAETDWKDLPSYPGTDQEEWRTYRQALRDLPSTASPKLDEQGNLTNVSWPTKPE